MAIIIENSRVPSLLSLFFPISAITIGPLIFIKKHNPPLSDTQHRILVNHEKIHVKQGLGLLFLGFWLLYLLFWVFALVKTRNPYEAYRDIPFEREAYCNDYDLEYQPGYFSWLRYL